MISNLRSSSELQCAGERAIYAQLLEAIRKAGGGGDVGGRGAYRIGRARSEGPYGRRKRFYQMKVGTKSVIFGVHSILIHPFFVAWAWWKLFGFPWDPRLWVAFFVHDLGYLAKPNVESLERLGKASWVLGGCQRTKCQAASC